MNESLKLAREQKKIATLNTVKDLMFNPVVEFVAGMYLIDTLYPDQKTTVNDRGQITKEVVTVQGPLGIGSGLKIMDVDSSGYATVSNKSTKGDWARDTLKWIIILQQIGPYAPAIISGAGTAITGITGAVAGALTKGAVK